MKENEWRIDHLIFGFSIGAIASYMLLSSSFVSSESVYMLIIFNLLFVSLTFPLDGTLTRKIFMLLIGNIIGLFWNYLFSLFAYTDTVKSFDLTEF
jgi:putative flippase GtrA